MNEGWLSLPGLLKPCTCCLSTRRRRLLLAVFLLLLLVLLVVLLLLLGAAARPAPHFNSHVQVGMLDLHKTGEHSSESISTSLYGGRGGGNEPPSLNCSR